MAYTKEEKAARFKEWYEKNKEQKAAYGKKHKAEQYKENRELILTRNKEWRDNNIYDTCSCGSKKKMTAVLCKSCHLESVRGEVSGLSKSQLKTWAKHVKDGYDNKCAVCGSVDNLDAHHIIPKHLNKDLALCIANGIALCKPHHLELHRYLVEVSPTC
jgi:5-methylcytosine-specific restriction endonuclease McrA